MPPRRVGYLKINGRDYALAPARFAQGPAIRVRSAAKDLLADPRRRDIIPVQGGMPGEFWLWYDRFDGGASYRHYRRPGSHRPTSAANDGDLADNRFPFLFLAGDVLETLTWTSEGASSSIWGIFEESGQLLVGHAAVVKILPATGTTVTEDVDLAVTDADATPFNEQNWERSNADVALVGTGSHIFSRNATWANAAIAAEYLIVGPDRLWKSYASSGSYFIANCLAGNDPLTAGNWSSGIRVGDASKPITGLAVLGDELLISTQGGLLGVTPDGVVFNRTPQVTVDSRNGKGTLSAFGYVWYPTIGGGLYAYRDGVVYPNQGPEAYTDVQLSAGNIQSMAQAGEWLYVALNNTDTVAWNLWRARLRTVQDEPGGILKWFLWRVSTFSTNDPGLIQMRLSDLTISDTLTAMLWVVHEFNGGIAQGYYIPTAHMYDTTENTLLTNAAAFVDTGEFWFPEDDLGFPAANKLLRGAMVYGRQINATRLVRVSGEFDQGTAFTNLDLTAAATLTNFAGSNLSGKVLTDWYLTLFDSADGLTGPIVERFGLRFFVRPDNDLVFTLSLLLDDDVRHAQGNPIVQDAESQLAALLALSENVVTITFGSSAAGSFTCLVADDVRFSLVEDDKERRLRYLCEVTLSVI